MKLKKYASALSNPALLFYKLCKSYVRSYEGYSYHFSKNGEARLLQMLSRQKIRTVFDIGANVGDWSQIAGSMLPNADIHAFELSDSTFKHLTLNADKHGFKANNFGLSDQAAEIVYKDYGDVSTLNTIVAGADFHDASISAVEKRAQVIRGDDYCTANNVDIIDFLKIDVEGAEHLVLNGFENMLANKRISVIQFEYGYVNGDAHFLMKDFFALFKKYGYVIGPLKPKGVIFGEFEYRLNDFKSGPNYVAVTQDRPDLIDAVKGKPIKGFF